jgi:hypothetical protein
MAARTFVRHDARELCVALDEAEEAGAGPQARGRAGAGPPAIVGVEREEAIDHGCVMCHAQLDEEDAPRPDCGHVGPAYPAASDDDERRLDEAWDRRRDDEQAWRRRLAANAQPPMSLNAVLSLIFGLPIAAGLAVGALVVTGVLR